MPRVSIIILTYNSERFIKDLLISLKEFAKDAEILIVDNDSKDATIRTARKFGDAVRVFETGKNLGFAKGINYGVDKSSGDFLLFINPDAVFKNGKLSDLIKVFENHEKAGIVGGKLIGHDGKNEKSAGKFFNLIETFSIVLGLDEKLGVRFSPDKLSRVDFVSGGFMMVKAEVFKHLNGFDENFFMYLEDMELCFRNKNAGYETYFTPDVEISHAGQGSSNRSFAIVNIFKGILYFYKKHKSKSEYMIVKILLTLKAESIYLLGRLTNNSYYTSTYKEALDAIR